jgi:hypothetical protein
MKQCEKINLCAMLVACCFSLSSCSFFLPRRLKTAKREQKVCSFASDASLLSAKHMTNPMRLVFILTINGIDWFAFKFNRCQKSKKKYQRLLPSQEARRKISLSRLIELSSSLLLKHTSPSVHKKREMLI